MAAVNAVQDVASLRLTSGYCPSLPLPIHGHVTPTWDLDNLPDTPDPLCSSSPTTTHSRSLRLLLRTEDNAGMSLSNSSSNSTFFGRLNVNCLEADLSDLETLSAFKLEVGMSDPSDSLAIENGTICDKSYAEAMESLSSVSTSNGDSDFGLMSSPELLVAMPIQSTMPNTPAVNLPHHYHSFSSPSPAQCPSPLSLSSPLPSSSSSTSSSNPNGAATSQLQTPQACPSCAKSFSNSSALSKHRLTHSDERKYGCQLCGKAFKRQDHLNGHLLTHRQKKPYECALEGCGKSYCDARSLRRHQDNHHNPRPSPSPSGGNLSQGEEPMTPTTPFVPGEETVCANFTAAPTTAAGPAVATIQMTSASTTVSPPSGHAPSELPQQQQQQQNTGSAAVGNKKTQGQPAKARQSKQSNVKPKKSGNKSGSSKNSDGDAGDKDAGLTSSQLELIQEIMRQTQEQHRLMQEEQEKALQQAGSQGHTAKKSSKGSGSGNGSSKSRQNPPTMATSPRPADARPVECTICQRKFKNIPALNGHMRLHGGYLKKETEPKKSDKKDPQLPPLQTASVSVRALIEEKIIQRRSAANPLFAAQHQSHSSSATETSTTTSNPIMTSSATGAGNATPAAEAASITLETPPTAQLNQTPTASNRHLAESTDPMDAVVESGLSDSVMDFNYEGLQPLSPETLNRALEVSETPRDSPGEVDSHLSFQGSCEANNVNFNSLLEDDVLHASLLLQDVEGLGDYSLNIPDMDAAQSRLLQATLQQYLVGTDESDLPPEAPPMPSHHAFLPDVDPASFFFATPPSSTSSSSSLGCLSDAHIAANASTSAAGGSEVPPPPYFPGTPTLENALIDPFMMDEPHSNALMWASPDDAQYLTMPCQTLSHSRTPSHTSHTQHTNPINLEPWATPPTPVMSSLPGNISTPTPTPSGKLFKALALKNSQKLKEKKVRKEKLKPLKLKLEKGIKQRSTACGAGSERRAYWTGFPSLLRNPKNLAASGLAVTSYTPAPCLDPRRLTRGCYYTQWRLIEETLEAESGGEAVKVTRSRPRIHVGSAFQCVIPNCNSSAAEKGVHNESHGDQELQEGVEEDELCWSPEIEERLGTKEVEQFLLWSQGQLPCGPKTTEQALTCLSRCQNVSQAKLRLLGMHSFATTGKSPSHILWSSTDIERFTKALASTTKDFTAVAQQVPGKSREDCVRFYYTWKRASADEYRRVQSIWKSNFLVTSPTSCSSPESPSENCSSSVKVLHLHVHVQHAHHRQQDSYPCKICGKLFSKVKSRSAHMKTHKPPELRVKSMTSLTPQSQAGSVSTSPVSGPASSCPTPSPVGL